MEISAFVINSFAKTIEGGNPAGVVLEADGLTEKDMLKISEKLGFSETAFVMKSDKADFKVRFFTPTDEVDLCGHATIATFHVLVQEKIITPGIYTQETKAGILSVEVKRDLAIMMEQNTPVYGEIISKEEIAESLNMPIEYMANDLPVQVVSTGLRDIMVPIKNIEIMDGINPDFQKVADISSKYNSTGYHLFTLESINGGIAYCRNFAPLYGIPEESATGTSNGALSSYLYKYDRLNPDKLKGIVIEQGYSMKKPSEIIVSLECDDDSINKVLVGGRAIMAEKRIIEL